MAKRFRTAVVNHRWVEACLTRGERVPELTYVLKSGEEVGPIRMQVPTSITERSDLLCRSNESTQRKVELEIESLENDRWNASHLLDEGSELKQLSTSLKRGKRNTSASGEFDYDLSQISRSTEKDSSHSESSSRRRRLVKKNNGGEASISPRGDSSKDCLAPLRRDPLDGATGMAIVRAEWTSGNGLAHQEEVTDHVNEDINDIGWWDLPAAENSSSVSCKALIGGESNAENIRSDTGEVGQTDISGKMTKTIELSCVVCWTDFSSTRGVLPCGHRFCYSCIWDWANHMTRSKKTSTCPLCKTSFMCITKVEDAACSDQKMYSQTIPHDAGTNVYLVSDQELLTNRAQLMDNRLAAIVTCSIWREGHETTTFKAWRNKELGMFKIYSKYLGAKQSSSAEPVCCRCEYREPEELLVMCRLCQTRCIHSYCLDPPLVSVDMRALQRSPDAFPPHQVGALSRFLFHET